MAAAHDKGAFHPSKTGLRKLLGDLEADVMHAVWQRVGEVSVREIHEALNQVRPLAYTTVMTIMGNLAKKGLLASRRDGKAYLYRPTQTYEEFTAAAVGRIVDELMKDFAGPTVAHFARALRRQGEP